MPHTQKQVTADPVEAERSGQAPGGIPLEEYFPTEGSAPGGVAFDPYGESTRGLMSGGPDGAVAAVPEREVTDSPVSDAFMRAGYGLQGGFLNLTGLWYTALGDDDSAKQFFEWSKSVREETQEIAGKAPEGAMGVAGDLIEGLGSIGPTTAAAGITALLTKNPVAAWRAAWITAGFQSLGSNFGEEEDKYYAHHKADPANAGEPDDVIRTMARSSAYLPALSAGIATALITKHVNIFGHRGIESVFTQQTLAKSLKEVGKAYGKGAISEFVEESSDQMANILISRAFSEARGFRENKVDREGKPITEAQWWWQAVKEASYAGFIGAFWGGKMQGLQAIAQRRKVNKALEAVGATETQQAVQAKLREHQEKVQAAKAAPEVFRTKEEAAEAKRKKLKVGVVEEAGLEEGAPKIYVNDTEGNRIKKGWFRTEAVDGTQSWEEGEVSTFATREEAEAFIADQVIHGQEVKAGEIPATGQSLLFPDEVGRGKYTIMEDARVKADELGVDIGNVTPAHDDNIVRASDVVAHSESAKGKAAKASLLKDARAVGNRLAELREAKEAKEWKKPLAGGGQRLPGVSEAGQQLTMSPEVEEKLKQKKYDEMSRAQVDEMVESLGKLEADAEAAFSLGELAGAGRAAAAAYFERQQAEAAQTMSAGEFEKWRTDNRMEGGIVSRMMWSKHRKDAGLDTRTDEEIAEETKKQRQDAAAAADAAIVKEVEDLVAELTGKGGKYAGMPITVQRHDSGGEFYLAANPKTDNVIYVDPANKAKFEATQRSAKAAVGEEIIHVLTYKALREIGVDVNAGLKEIWSKLTQGQRDLASEIYESKLDGAHGGAEFVRMLLQKEHSGKLTEETGGKLPSLLERVINFISELFRNVDIGTELQQTIDTANDIRRRHRESIVVEDKGKSKAEKKDEEARLALREVRYKDGTLEEQVSKLAAKAVKVKSGSHTVVGSNEGDAVEIFTDTALRWVNDRLSTKIEAEIRAAAKKAKKDVSEASITADVQAAKAEFIAGLTALPQSVTDIAIKTLAKKVKKRSEVEYIEGTEEGEGGESKSPTRLPSEPVISPAGTVAITPAAKGAQALLSQVEATVVLDDLLNSIFEADVENGSLRKAWLLAFREELNKLDSTDSTRKVPTAGAVARNLNAALLAEKGALARAEVAMELDAAKENFLSKVESSQKRIVSPLLDKLEAGLTDKLHQLAEQFEGKDKGNVDKVTDALTNPNYHHASLSDNKWTGLTNFALDKLYDEHYEQAAKAVENMSKEEQDRRYDEMVPLPFPRYPLTDKKNPKEAWLGEKGKIAKAIRTYLVNEVTGSEKAELAGMQAEQKELVAGATSPEAYLERSAEDAGRLKKLGREIKKLEKRVKRGGSTVGADKAVSDAMIWMGKVEEYMTMGRLSQRSVEAQIEGIKRGDRAFDVLEVTEIIKETVGMPRVQEAVIWKGHGSIYTDEGTFADTEYIIDSTEIIGYTDEHRLIGKVDEVGAIILSDNRDDQGAELRWIGASSATTHMLERFDRHLGWHSGGEQAIFAHARFTIRTAPNGERYLVLEELQSDWETQLARAERDTVKNIAGVLEKIKALKLMPKMVGHDRSSSDRTIQVIHPVSGAPIEVRARFRLVEGMRRSLEDPTPPGPDSYQLQLDLDPEGAYAEVYEGVRTGDFTEAASLAVTTSGGLIKHVGNPLDLQRLLSSGEFAEEMQVWLGAVWQAHSDKEFTPTTAPFPFRQSWPEMLFRRALRIAAEKELDGVVLPTTEEEVTEGQVGFISPNDRIGRLIGFVQVADSYSDVKRELKIYEPRELFEKLVEKLDDPKYIQAEEDMAWYREEKESAELIAQGAAPGGMGLMSDQVRREILRFPLRSRGDDPNITIETLTLLHAYIKSGTTEKAFLDLGITGEGVVSRGSGFHKEIVNHALGRAPILSRYTKHMSAYAHQFAQEHFGGELEALEIGGREVNVLEWRGKDDQDFIQKSLFPNIFEHEEGHIGGQGARRELEFDITEAEKSLTKLKAILNDAVMDLEDAERHPKIMPDGRFRSNSVLKNTVAGWKQRLNKLKKQLIDLKKERNRFTTEEAADVVEWQYRADAGEKLKVNFGLEDASIDLRPDGTREPDAGWAYRWGRDNRIEIDIETKHEKPSRYQGTLLPDIPGKGAVYVPARGFTVRLSRSVGMSPEERVVARKLVTRLRRELRSWGVMRRRDKVGERAKAWGGGRHRRADTALSRRYPGPVIVNADGSLNRYFAVKLARLIEDSAKGLKVAEPRPIRGVKVTQAMKESAKLLTFHGASLSEGADPSDVDAQIAKENRDVARQEIARLKKAAEGKGKGSLMGLYERLYNNLTLPQKLRDKMLSPPAGLYTSKSHAATEAEALQIIRDKKLDTNKIIAELLKETGSVFNTADLETAAFEIVLGGLEREINAAQEVGDTDRAGEASERFEYLYEIAALRLMQLGRAISVAGFVYSAGDRIKRAYSAALGRVKQAAKLKVKVAVDDTVAAIGAAVGKVMDGPKGVIEKVSKSIDKARRTTKARAERKKDIPEEDKLPEETDAEFVKKAFLLLKRHIAKSEGTGRRDPVRTFVNQLVKAWKKNLELSAAHMHVDERKRIPKMTPQELLIDLLSKRKEAGAAFDAAFNFIHESFKNEKGKLADASVVLDQFAEMAYTLSAISGVVKTEADIKSLIRQHYSKTEEKAGEIAGKINEGLALKLRKEVGLGDAEAASLQKAVLDEMTRQTEAAKKRALAKIIKDAAQRDKAVGRALRSQTGELIRLSHLGALTNEEVYKALLGDENLGLPAWNAEVAATLDEMAKAVDASPDGTTRVRLANDMLKYIEGQKGLNMWDLGLAYYYSSILSGVGTQGVNFFGSFSNLILRTIREMAANPLYAKRILQALVDGLSKGRLEFKAAMQGDMSGRRTFDPYAAYDTLIEVGEKGEHATAPNPLEMAALDERKWAKLVGWMRMVNRLMAGTDLMFFKTAEEMKAAAIAIEIAKKIPDLTKAEILTKVDQILRIDQHENAMSQAQAEGLEGLNYERRALEIIEQMRSQELMSEEGDVMDVARPELMGVAGQFGKETTFTQNPQGILGWIAGAIEQAVRAGEKRFDSRAFRFMKAFVVPFTRTIANVMTEKLAYVPVLGGIRALPFMDKVGWNLTDEQKSMLKFQQIFGSVTMMLLAYAIWPDDDDEDEFIEITAMGVKDKEQRAQLRESGWRPYTLKIGSMRFNYGEWAVGNYLAVLGAASDQLRYGKEEDDQWAAILGAGLWQQVAAPLNQGFLSQMSILNKAIANEDEAGLGKYLGRLPAGLVPRIAKDVEKAFFNEQTDMRTAAGAIASQFPAVRHAFKPALNVLGEPVMAEGTERIALGRLAKWDASDPFFDLLRRKGTFVPVPRGEVAFGNRTMTNDEKYDFLKRSGERMAKNLRNPATLRSMEGMSREALAKYLSSQSRGARAVVKSQMNAEARRKGTLKL